MLNRRNFIYNFYFSMEDASLYENICRLCLNSEDSDKFVSLIETDGQNDINCYGQSVKRFAQISIEKDDKLPKNMCQKCLFLLKCAIYFKFTCENSEKILKKWSKKHVNNRRKKTSLDVVNYNQELSKQYFPDENHENPSKDCSIVIEISAIDKQAVDENENSNDNIFQDNSIVEAQSDDTVQKCVTSKLSKLRKNTAEFKNYIHKRRLQKSKINGKKEKYECTICKKVLANPATYSNHMEYHYGCRFICEHCGKGFPVLGRLQIHQIAVHDTGPYLPCQYCSYHAPTKVKLTEHLRLHTGERPFTCDKCGLTFRRRAIWKKHMVHHSDKTVQCPQCPRKFFTIYDLRAHSNNVHDRRYMYTCHKCDTTYAKTETVRKHLTEVHGIPREMQGKITRINRGKPNIVEP